MKKSILFFILIVVLCVMSPLVILSACNSDDEHEHKWDDGVITTQPTCITPGVITFRCEYCDEQRKEILDSNSEHVWSNYSYDEEYHWRVCNLCGESEKHEHDFGDTSKYSDADEFMTCDCGINKTVGEFYSYKVTFVCSDGVSVLIYNTQDYTVGGIESTVAYARDGDTGELINNGDGQVNFEIVPAVGYKISNVAVTSGTSYKNLKDPAEIGRENTYRLTKITGEGLVVTVTAEIDCLDLPVMIINTENAAPILDKENYVNCVISVGNADSQYCFNDASAGIRGRGNTTWSLLKKPYKIKFNSKIDLFGNGSAKKWTLIANFSDPSMARNFLAYSIAGENGLLTDTKYTTSMQFIELYLNGEYCGVYLLCEQIEAGSNRVEIDESLQNSDGTVNVNTGYLLESDNAYTPNEGVEGLDYFKVNGVCYAIKSPDVEDSYYIANKEAFIAFIQNVMQTAVDNLNNLPNSPENFEIISMLLDVPSFVDGYLIDELTNITDGAYSSFYLYYDSEDGKIYRGPIWDYDASCGNAAYYGNTEPTFLRASLIFWYERLLQFDKFKLLVKERLNEISENNAFINFINAKYAELMKYQDSFDRNFEKWDMVLGQDNLSHWNTDIIISLTTWKEQVDYLLEWLTESFNYILSVYCTD